MHSTTSSIAQRPTSLIRATGWSYFPVALVARLPFAMMVVGLLTLVVSARGSLALAGMASAMTGLGTAVFGPLLGAASDRFGQRRVLLAAGTANSLLLLAIAWLAFAPVKDAVVLAVAFAIGATMPQVAPLSRSRLVGIIARTFRGERRGRVLSGTMAYESAADEVVFVFGPVVVGLLATTQGPAAPVIGAALMALVFVTGFALHPTARASAADDARPADAAAGAPDQAPVIELLSARVLVPVLGTLGMGLFFGSMLTSLTAFMADRGAAEQAGLVYGAMGIGSAGLALTAAALPTRFTLPARWVVFGGVLVAGAAAIPLAQDVATMSACLLIVGMGIGPTLVTQYSLAAEASPHGRSATVMTMMGSAVVVGQAAASALVGLIAEEYGTSAAVIAPMIAAGVVFAAALAQSALARRARGRVDACASL